MDKEFDFFKELYNFQSKYDVSKIKIENLSIWPLIIFEFRKYVSVDDKKETKNNTNYSLKAFKQFFGYFRMKRKINNENRRIALNTDKKKKDILFLTSSARRQKIDDKYYDRICDPFVEALKDLKYNCEILEWSYDNQIKVPTYFGSKYIQDSIIKAYAFSILDKKKLNLELNLLDTAEFSSLLDMLGILKEKFISNVISDFRIIKKVQYRFDRIIKKNDYKCAFFFPYYGVVSFAFNLACKENSVFSVEIQHGYHSDKIRMRNEFRNIGIKYELFPDAMWSWEESDVKYIQKWSNNKDVIPFVYKGGNLWNNKWKHPKLNETRKIDNFDFKLKAKYSSVVLFTLSPNIENPDWIIKSISSDENVLWLIRFHHNTTNVQKLDYQSFFGNLTNINYEIANEYTLPQLLQHTDAHITVRSSCVGEAKEFNVKTIFIGDFGVYTYENYINDGWAYAALSHQEFNKTLKMILSKPKFNFQSDQYIKSNKEIVQEFMEIIGKQKEFNEL